MELQKAGFIWGRKNVAHKHIYFSWIGPCVSFGGKKKEEEEGCSSRQGPGSSWIQGVSAMKSPFRDAHVNLIYWDRQFGVEV